MNQPKTGRYSRLALAVALASSFGTAHAAQLEEIVVTAQKRAESLQDVPISISTVDGSKIEQAGISNLEDLTAYVPNLMLSENAVATSIILRGIGPGANQSFEQSVGLYADGIHLAKGRQSRSGLFDVERVEVLRGPQGILFGKNTLAGAVNVTTATPQVGDELGGRLAVSRESFDGTIIEGNVSGSLTDNFAMRFAIKDSENEGYLTNGFSNNVGPGPTLDETLWRLSATWEPSENTSVKFKYAEGEHTRVGSTATIRTFTPVTNLAPSGALAFGVISNFFPQIGQNVASGTADTFRDSVSIGGLALAQSLGRDLNRTAEKPEGTDTETTDFSLNVDVDFGDGYTFTSVTGRSEYEYEDGIDADFLPIQFVGRSDISEYEQTSQEFRISSDPSKKFSFIGGVYWEEQTQEIDRTVIFDGTLGLAPPVVTSLVGAPSLLALPPGAIPGVPFGLNGVSIFNQAGRVSRWVQETDSWAIFFQGEYQLSDELTLTAGLRYTEEDKFATGSARITTDTTGLATHNPSPILGAVLRGVAPTTFDHDYAEGRTTDQLTPAVSLEWSPTDNSNYYASYSEGFKSGGFNAVDDQAPDLTVAPVNGIFTTPGAGWRYEDETATSFEIGGKHSLANGSMELNWALFTSEYDDQQVSTFVGVGFVVRNAATSKVDGLELDWRWQATDSLQVSASVALLDASYDSFPSAGCTAIQASDITGLLAADPTATVSSGACTSAIGADGNRIANQDLAGAPLTHAPDYSGSVSVTYTQPLGGDWELLANVDLNFTDDYLLTGDLDPIDIQTGFEKINLQVGVSNENWEIMLYGRNITDELTASGGFDVPLASGAHAIYTDPSRAYGARVSYRF